MQRLAAVGQRARRGRLDGRGAGDHAGQIEAGHAGQLLGAPAQRADVGVVGRDHGAQRALAADVPRQGAGVDAADGEHVVSREPVEPARRRGPVEGVVDELAGDDRPGLRLVGLVARRVGAVVAVQRERVGDDLAAVRRVGGDLLVARHGRVEDDLAADRAGAGHGLAAVGGAVLEDQERGARHDRRRPRARRRP